MSTFQSTTTAGIPGLDDLPWGSHACHFYRDGPDLIATLVPFFAAGLESGERCVWAAAEPVAGETARRALAARVPDLAERESAGQISFPDAAAWHRETGGGDGTVEAWVARERDALARGFAGLRCSFDTGPLDRHLWRELIQLEQVIDRAVVGRRIVALCGYSLDRCSGGDALDVFCNHRLTLIRKGEHGWRSVESRSLQIALDEVKRLQRADALRERFLSVLGHELKNPLNVLHVSVESLREGGRLTDERDRAATERITGAVRRMHAVVSELLDYARSSHGLVLRRAPVDMREICRAVLEEIAVLHPRRHVELLERGAAAGSWDRERLAQVVSNLVGNAVAHGEDPIVVELRLDGADQVLEVRNAGPPIPENELPLLFEPFRRSSSARGPTSHGAGLGLGLFLVREAVRAHGGEIAVRSGPPDGTTSFTVRLPLAEPAA